MEDRKFTTKEYYEAKKMVDRKIGFYFHLIVFIIVNAFFHYNNFKYGGSYWAFWPLAGWGVGLFFHSIKVFGFFNNTAWKEKQIQKELEKRDRYRDSFK